eukprot:846628-Amphidinium_carterae.1
MASPGCTTSIGTQRESRNRGDENLVHPVLNLVLVTSCSKTIWKTNRDVLTLRKATETWHITIDPRHISGFTRDRQQRV